MCSSYLQRAFREDLPRVMTALQKLALGFRDVKTLQTQAYGVYKLIRPAVPHGMSGWGARGEVDLGYIGSLEARARDDALRQVLP